MMPMVQCSCVSFSLLPPKSEPNCSAQWRHQLKFEIWWPKVFYLKEVFSASGQLLDGGVPWLVHTHTGEFLIGLTFQYSVLRTESCQKKKMICMAAGGREIIWIQIQEVIGYLLTFASRRTGDLFQLSLGSVDQYFFVTGCWCCTLLWPYWWSTAWRPPSRRFSYNDMDLYAN